MTKNMQKNIPETSKSPVSSIIQDFPVQKTPLCITQRSFPMKRLCFLSSNSVNNSEESFTCVNDNSAEVCNLSGLACGSKERIGIDSKFNSFCCFFNYSFFCNNFFNYCFFSNSFFNYCFFSNNFFNCNFFSYNFFNCRNGSEKGKESNDCFFRNFDTVKSNSSLEGVSSDFNAACEDSGYHFGSEFNAVGCSESNDCVYVNNSSFYCFFNNCFFSSFFHYCFFSNSFNSCFFSDRFNSSFFCENSRSHSSTHQSCKDERKSFLHFEKYPP